MNRTVTNGLVLGVAIAVLASCGGAEPEAGYQPWQAPSPAETTYAALSGGQLERALLTAAELPAGFAADPPTPPDPKTFCDVPPPAATQEFVARAFTEGSGLSTNVVRVGLREYASNAEASEVFEAMLNTLADCPGETVEGAQTEYAPAPAPQVGDRSVAVLVSVSGAKLLQHFTVVGPMLISVASGGLSTPESDAVAALLQKQVDRYRAAAG